MLDSPDRAARAKATEQATNAVVAAPCAMVIFGAAADLTKRLVVPGLYNLANDHQLSEKFHTVEAGWQVVQPILDKWANTPPRDFPNYVAGSSGPAAPRNCWRATAAPGGRSIEQGRRNQWHRNAKFPWC